MKKKGVVLAVLLTAVTGIAFGVTEPPALLNYQGVLRNVTDDPQTGSFDMEFGFYDDTDPDCGDGTLLLTDRHLAAGTGDVAVTGGLFNVSLGGGTLAAGTESGLSAVFRNHSSVYLEVRVEAAGGGLETLCPRIRIVSAAYSFGADHLDGLDSSQFLRSDVATTFAGPSLTINTSGGTNAVLGEASVDRASAAPETFNITNSGSGAMTLQVDGFTAWHAGNDGAGTTLDADLLDGNDSSYFIKRTASTQTIDGSLTIGTGAPTTRLTLNTASGPDTEITEYTLTRESDVDQTFQLYNPGPGDLNVIVGGDLTVQGETITFGNVNTKIATLFWDYSLPRFELSEGLAIGSVLRVGSTSAAPVAYNQIGNLGAPTVPADIGSVNDLFLSGDLETGGSVFVQESVVVGDSTPTANQAFSSFGEAGNKDEGAIIAGKDVYIAGGLEVDGTTFAETLTITGTKINGRSNIHLQPADTFDVVLGDGISVTPDVDLEVSAGGVCVDDDGNCIPPIDGHVKAFVFDAAGHSDIAETYPSAEKLAPGDVVVVDRSADGRIRKSSAPNERGYVSVVSTAPGIVLGSATDQDLATHGLDPEKGPNFGELLLVPGTYPVVLMGRVPVKVSDENGPIARGDFLTTSSTPGVAMRATEPAGVLGQALQEWREEGIGMITAWVAPGVHGPGGAQGGPPRGDGKSHETQAVSGNLRIVLDEDANDSARLSVFRDGEGGLDAEVLRVDEEGNVYARGSFRPAALDLAEYHPVSEPVSAGDVLVIDRGNPGRIQRGSTPSDPAVFGIVSSAPGVLLGSALTRIRASDPVLAARLDEARARGDRAAEAALWKQLETEFQRTHAAVALSGTVPCKVDAGYGSIGVGDLLTVSPTPGHAMRSTDGAPGTIVGKALQSLETGTGVIQVLVMLR